jgi:site-specific recombinase XerD
MRIPTVKIVHDRRHNGIVEIRISMNNKVHYISTGVKTNSLASMSVTDHQRVQIIRNNVEQYINECIASSVPVDIASLRNRAIQEAAPTEFIDFCCERAEHRDVRPATKKRYDVFVNSLDEYGKLCTFHDLTPGNIMKYIEWIRENKNVSQAGVYNYYKCVRSFCADAVLFGHVQSNPCDKLVGKVSRGTRFLIEYLTDEELETIITTDMPSQMTEHARDLFIFMCFTGLRYSDLVTFDINNYEIVNGKYQANDEAIKTGRVYVSQLLTPAVKILQKYDFKLPMMSNQKLNFALKGVQVVCGIKKRLHAHLGRHTFATYMLSHGASPQNVMKMLGHTNIQQTMQYAAVLAKDVHADYAKIDEMFK